MEITALSIGGGDVEILNGVQVAVFGVNTFEKKLPGGEDAVMYQFAEANKKMIDYYHRNQLAGEYQLELISAKGEPVVIKNSFLKN